MSNIDNFDTPKYKNLATYLNVEEITNINRVEILSNLLVEKKKYRVQDGRPKVICFCGHKIKNYQYIHNRLNGEKLFAGSSCVHIFDICNPTSRVFIDRRYYNNFINLFGTGEFVNIEDWGEYTLECLYQYLSDCNSTELDRLKIIIDNYPDDIKNIISNIFKRICIEKIGKEEAERIEQLNREEWFRQQREDRERIKKEEEYKKKEEEYKKTQLDIYYKNEIINELKKELKWRKLCKKLEKKEQKDIVIGNKNRLLSQLKEKFNLVKKMKKEIKDSLFKELTECPMVILQRIRQVDYDRQNEIIKDKKWYSFIKSPIYIKNNPFVKYSRLEWKQTDAFKNFHPSV
jgi:hypothetical protein